MRRKPLLPDQSECALNRRTRAQNLWYCRLRFAPRLMAGLGVATRNPRRGGRRYMTIRRKMVLPLALAVGALVVDEHDVDTAVTAAHQAFDLQADQVEAVVYGGTGR